MMIYGETFYGRHTAQHQLQYSKIKVKQDCLWKQRTHKKIWKIGDSVWLTDVWSFATLSFATTEQAYAVLDFQNNQNGLNGPKPLFCAMTSTDSSEE